MPVHNGGQALRVVELTRSVAGAVCGRLFAALGHEVTLCEPSAGHPLRVREFTFIATGAGKRSMVCDPALDVAAWEALLPTADVLIHDLTPTHARELGLDVERLAERFPRLVTVSITPFGLDGELAEMPGDSFLAEAFGGLAQMIGEPTRSPLSLGGDQAAHAAAFVGLFGAALALRRRDQLGTGDHVEVALSDVVAYMDWKSDVMHDQGLGTPSRSGASRGTWRIVEAVNGWVGVIFLAHQLGAVAELTGDARLADPRLLDVADTTGRTEELWAVLADAIRHREATEVYAAAQRLGLPFGYAATAADLLASEQLLTKGFVIPAKRLRRDAPVVAFPVPDGRSAELERAPSIGEDATVDRNGDRRVMARGTAAKGERESAAGPLAGLLVLDFGTITAGAATGRLLADYGATVIKIESSKRPDLFRQWVIPGAGAAVTPAVSPMFASNNVGKGGLCVDLKTEGGRRIVHDLIRQADVLVENFRAGVTTRMGIDPDTARDLNPNLIYLSLSSQGSTGPESSFSSYGSTLDLLSGLAGATGYQGAAPIWSSGDVNYPDQIVALAGAALVAHAVATGRRGALLDISQRELVAWTLADQLAAFVFEGVPIAPSGNRRPGAVPHDVYPTCGETWVAIACFDDGHRRALTGLIPDLPAGETEQWWWAHQDEVDATIAAWASTRSREQAVAELHAAGVPAVPVCSAADRAAQPHYRERRVALRGPDGNWLKGFPLVLRGFTPEDPAPAPDLGEDMREPDDNLRDASGVIADWTVGYAKRHPLASLSTLGAQTVLAVRTVQQFVIDLVTGRFQWAEFVRQSAFMAGTAVLPTVLVALPIGVTLSIQFALLAGQVGANSLAGAASGLAIIRQAASLVAAVLMASAVGSAITADLGSRTMREEIDAMEVMGVPVINRLVVPRFGAAIMIGLALTGITSFVGFLASYLFNVYFQHGAPGSFVATFSSFATPADMINALLKAVLFGGIVAVVACQKGLSTKGGPAGVANSVNAAVVESILILMVVNVGISQLYNMLFPRTGL